MHSENGLFLSLHFYDRQLGSRLTHRTTGEWLFDSALRRGKKQLDRGAGLDLAASFPFLPLSAEITGAHHQNTEWLLQNISFLVYKIFSVVFQYFLPIEI